MRPSRLTRRLEPNPVTRAAYRRQAGTQIYLPLGIGLIALVVLVAVLWQGSVGSARAWADVSAIVLLLPVIVVGLLGLILISAAAYAVGWLVGWLPGYAAVAQRYVAQAQFAIGRMSDVAATPVTIPRSAWAGARAALAALVRFARGEGWLHGE